MSLGKRANERLTATALIARPILLLPLALALSGCRPGEPAGNKLNSALPELKLASNMSLPADTQVLFDKEERGGDGYRSWVLHSKDEFNLPPGARAKVPADIIMQMLERLLPDRRIGKLSNPDAQTSEWANQRGTWRAAKIMTETG